MSLVLESFMIETLGDSLTAFHFKKLPLFYLFKFIYWGLFGRRLFKKLVQYNFKMLHLEYFLVMNPIATFLRNIPLSINYSILALNLVKPRRRENGEFRKHCRIHSGNILCAKSKGKEKRKKESCRRGVKERGRMKRTTQRVTTSPSLFFPP